MLSNIADQKEKAKDSLIDLSEEVVPASGLSSKFSGLGMS